MNFIIVSPNLLSWPCCVFFFSSSTAYTHFNLSPACTFLGPSRKRGPPKGYIDAIEARLHQTEALLGIMIATTDERAQSLLRDLSKVCSISISPLNLPPISSFFDRTRLLPYLLTSHDTGSFGEGNHKTC